MRLRAPRSEQHRQGRIPLALGLAALVLLPTLALAVLAAGRAADAARSAQRAERLATRTDELADLVRYRHLINREHTALGTIVTARAIGLDAAAIEPLLGFDPRVRAAETRTELQTVLERVGGVPAVAAVETALAEPRGYAPAGDDPARITGPYQQMEDVLNEAIVRFMDDLRTRASLSGSADVQLALVTLEDAFHAFRAATAEVAALAKLLLPVGDPRGAVAVLAGATSRQQDASARLDARSTGAAREAWERAAHDPESERFEEVIESAVTGVLEQSGSGVVDVGAVAAILRGGLERIDGHFDTVVAASGDLRAASVDLRNSSRTDLKLVVVLLGVTLVATIVGAERIARSIRQPLVRLEAQAHALSDGALAISPLEERGPREVAVVTRAFNDMTDNLRAVERQATALAAGRLDAPELRRSLGNGLGRALQESVARLSQSIVEREELRRQLSHDATHDGLTGIANRTAAIAALEERLEPRASTASAFAVLFVDLDGFKQINDLYGHLTGDEVLREVARRLAHAVRPGDHVARFGGDEFLVIADSVTDLDDALRVGERLRTAMSGPFAVAGGTVSIHASVGVTIATDGSTALTLIAAADHAAYAAKSRGKGCVEAFTGDLPDTLTSEAAVEAGWDTERDGTFELHS